MIEVSMPAYLLLLVAVLSRLLPHAGWLNFTAVGGALLYFGARRSWREMMAPLAALIAADYFLTVYVYQYGFRWQEYMPTWAWCLMAMALGRILLKSRTTFVRVAAGTLLGPTSFLLCRTMRSGPAAGAIQKILLASPPATRLACPSIATTCSRRPSFVVWRLGFRCWCGG